MPYMGDETPVPRRRAARYNRRFRLRVRSMSKVADEKVLVLDFGSQYAQLIARRVRQQNVYCEIVRHNITAERVGQLAPKGLILSGGPASVYEPGARAATRRSSRWASRCSAFATGCSWPATSSAAGSRAARPGSMDGPRCRVVHGNELFADAPAEMPVWMSHGDQVPTSRPTFSHWLRRGPAPSPPCATAPARSTGSSSIPR